MNWFIHLIISLLYGWHVNTYDVKKYAYMYVKKQKVLIFSSKINLDELMMTYVGLSATSERSMTPFLSGV